MLKKIIYITLAITILSFSTIKTHALELPENAYNVPWDINDKYIIYKPINMELIFVQLYNDNIVYNSSNDRLYFDDIGWSYFWSNNDGNWVLYSKTNDILNSRYRNIDFQNNVYYSSHDIKNNNGNILFTQRPFLSLRIIRERATTEAIMGMEDSMSKAFGTLLPIGLAILSLLLLPILLVRLVQRFLA